MIVLNIERELVRVEAWGDIVSRPGFTESLDPKCHVLNSIIGRYNFADKIRCGLSNCHTPHAKGYIVVTKDGRETNIGKDCGRNYFGVDFEAMSRKFDQDIADKEGREKLWSFHFRVEEIKQKVQALRSMERGADWIYRKVKSLLETGHDVPATIVRYIADKVKARDPVVTQEREATTTEIDRMEVERGRRLSRPQYIAEPIATIDGFEALYQENDLRAMLILDVEEKIRLFEGVSIDSMDSAGISRWSRWVGTVDATLEQAESVVQVGRRLLTSQNLQHFEYRLTEKDDRRSFSRFLKSLDTA